MGDVKYIHGNFGYKDIVFFNNIMITNTCDGILKRQSTNPNTDTYFVGNNPFL